MTKKVFVHPSGINESCDVGSGTRIWAFAHVLSGAKIGRNCNICDHVFIEGNVILGDNVTVKCGVQLWSGLRVENNVFIGPNATFTNDLFPRSKRHLDKHAISVLEEGCSIGANATILPGVTVGRYAMVGAGAVVTQTVPPFAIVMGNPARITGYAGATQRLEPLSVTAGSPAADNAEGLVQSVVKGVTLRRLKLHSDMRGDLCVLENGEEVPFAVKRQFFVFNVPSPQVRGQHAHIRCHQFLICLHGSCSVVADDGRQREEFLLNDCRLGLHLPPLTWAQQYRYSPETVLLVLASRRYEAADYIRDYGEFLRRIGRTNRIPR